MCSPSISLSHQVIAEISRDHIRPGVHVADHALAGGNRARELVADGMSGLISWNAGIGGSGLSQISGGSVSAGVFRRTVVGIDHVAGAAPAGAVVAGLIVGAGERQQRIEQARLLQSQKNRIGAQFGAEAALAQLDLRLARLFFEAGIPYLWLFPPPRSKTRKTLPGCEISQRCSGSRYGSTPFLLTSSGVGGGKVSNRCGVPSAP